MSNVEKTDKSEKFKALKLTMDKIDKDFGKGSVMMMNEKTFKLALCSCFIIRLFYDK